MTLQQILREHPFMAELTEGQIETLVGLASEGMFQKNEVILQDSRRSTSFYLLTSGSVAVELRTPAYVVCIQALGVGQVFGWSALLEHQETLFQVRARERTTALRLDGAQLQAACRADAALGAKILHRALQVVAGRVWATEIRFAEMCGVKVGLMASREPYPTSSATIFGSS